MKRFRSVLFWTHLAAGLVCGVIIFIMSFTGVVLAFESELVAWAERDARQVEVPASAQRLSADELLAAFGAAQPEVEASGLQFSADPAAAAVVSAGRRETYFLNPYTGDVLTPASTRMHDFMRLMTSWHRWLAQEGDSRGTGKAITGVSNTAFLVLALTGLYLWFPRQWTARFLKPALWFTGASGKARDFNWHNVFGFWMLIPIAVMSATGMVISYKWAGNLVYRAVGEEPPVRRGPPGPPRADNPGAGVDDPGSPVVPLDTFFTLAASDQPDWTSLSLRLPTRGTTASVTVKSPHDWPRTASTTLSIDATAGLGARAITERSTFADQSTGRQLRSWMRFLHTGQALGWLGQLVAGLGCVAGCFLCYTGFALSYRRFFGRKRVPAETPVT